MLGKINTGSPRRILANQETLNESSSGWAIPQINNRVRLIDNLFTYQIFDAWKFIEFIMTLLMLEIPVNVPRNFLKD